MIALVVAFVAQSADAAIAWRARTVAGREVVMECRGEDCSGGQGGTDFRWSERVRDVVVAFDGRSGRGMRLREFKQSESHPSTETVEFFDVDAEGRMRPTIGYEVGIPARHEDGIEVGWSHRIALRLSDFEPRRRVALTTSREAAPSSLQFALGEKTGFEASLAATEAGVSRIDVVPCGPLPIAFPDPVRPHRLGRLAWTLEVDAHGTLIGESTSAKLEYLDAKGVADYAMIETFSWLETAVEQIDGDALLGVRAEVDALRRAHEVFKRVPEVALERLDAYAKLPEPRRFDAVAKRMRDAAIKMAKFIDWQVASALVEATGGEAAAPPPALETLLEGWHLTRAHVHTLFDLGRRIAWVERRPEAQSQRAAKVVDACASRLALDDEERRLVVAIVAKGLADENFDRERDDDSAPPPDLDAVDRSIDAAFALTAK